VQFKFNVDGQWRYDEQQPFVNGNYGVVNTIYLVREPDILPAILSAETSSRSHMEVDNDVFGHAVSLFFLLPSAHPFVVPYTLVLSPLHIRYVVEQVMMPGLLFSPVDGRTVHSNTT
jgi:hypothetical protein